MVTHRRYSYSKIILVFCFIAFFNLPAQSQLKVKEIENSELPTDIQYEGNVIQILKWKDQLGDNLSMITTSGIYYTAGDYEDSENANSKLYGYHFIIRNDSVFQNWKVYDFVVDCGLDIGSFFIPNTFQVTDLDQNGIAEIWMVYQQTCRSDVSPLEMKIIMYEGKKKYALRGENKISMGLEDDNTETFYGGEYSISSNFSNGPKVFFKHAKQLWKENMLFRFED